MSSHLTADHLAALARAGVVVLSPHFDDACFSLGGLLQALGQGVLVNVFSRSTYLARPPAGQPAPQSADEVFALRDAEDAAFASRCGLRRITLTGVDPTLGDPHPSPLARLQHDVRTMQAPLQQALQSLVRRDAPRQFLLLPMAMGRHVNHHAVHALVAQARAQWQPHFHLCLYEDLPYANDPLQRIGRLRQLAREAAWTGLRRYTYTPGWDRKKALVSLYPTQLRRAPARWKFRPASLWPWGVHEALWMDAQAFSALNP